MERITILGCGDVGPLDGPMSRYGDLVRPVLAQADSSGHLRSVN